MKYLLTVITLLGIQFACAQNINWNSLNEDQKSLTYLNFGYDYGVTTQLGYGYKTNKWKPILFTADYSFPMGENWVDDFKIRLGGQISIFEKQNFILSAKAYLIYRKHKTELVSMSNFGSETAIVLGYYKTKWHIAGEFGYDKSALTYLNHSTKMKEIYPDITNGWFSNSGGNLYYGIQGSKTIGNKTELSMRMVSTNAQFDDQNAMLPLYFKLGIVIKLGNNNK